MNWLSYFAAIMQMLPGILDLVVKVESIVGAGQGPAKAAMVTGAVTAAVQSDPQVTAATQGHDLNAVVGNVATAMVNGLNASGVFKHGAAQ